VRLLSLLERLDWGKETLRILFKVPLILLKNLHFGLLTWKKAGFGIKAVQTIFLSMDIFTGISRSKLVRSVIGNGA
jgi:hypothetical protein